MSLAASAWKALGAACLVVLSFAASAQPVWQSSQTAVGTGNAVVNRPAGTVSGDLLIVGLMVEKGSGETITTPGGWTLIRRTNQSSNAGMATYYRVAGGSEPASYTFNIANGSKWSIGISRITGADTSNPIDADNGTTGSSGTTVTAPGVTTTVANSLVLAFYTNKKNSTYNPAGSTTERYDVPNNPGGLPSNMMATFVQAGAGATGNRNATSSDSESWVGQQVAIRFGNSAPPAPSLLSPADGATVSSDTPAFDWTDVADPQGHSVTYEMQADNSGCGFASPEVNQTGLAASTFTPGAALADGTYCWRARAVDQYGAAGPWSTTRNLTVDAVTTTSQTRDPANCGTVSVGDQPWSNSANAASSNNSVATSTVDGEVTDPLYCLDYAFNIPSNATILGIEVMVERRSDRTQNGGSRDNYLYLVKALNPVGSNGATATTYTTSDVVEAHGSASHLWGTTWTPAEINAANFGAVFSATKPSSQGQEHVISVDHIQITVHYSIPNVATPGSFNAFETSTAANAVTGQLFTKRSAVNFSVDVVAVLSGTQLATFTDTVLVDLVTGSTGGANCPGTPAQVSGSSQNVNLTGGRGTTANFYLASAHPDVRVRIRYPVASPTVTSCSTDNFAIRPSSFTVSSSNATNNTTSGTPTIKAGASFNLTAASGVSGYSGTPTLDNSLVVGSPTAGTISGSFGSGNASGTASGSAFTYSEAGIFGLGTNAVRDASFTAVDQPNDCTADFSNVLVGGKYGCYFGSSAIAMTPGTSGFGRFIPDHFFVAAGASLTNRWAASCSTPSAFSYMNEGVRFAWTLQARNSAGAVTQNYAGAYAKLAPTTIAQLSFGAVNGATNLTSRLDLSLGSAGSFAAGAASITATVGISRRASPNDDPDGPFTATKIGIAPSDSDGVTVRAADMNMDVDGAGGADRVQIGANTEIRFGRLRMENAVGSEKLALSIPIRTQYWNGTAFETNTLDDCTVLQRSDIALDFTPSSNLTACETAVSTATIAFTGGVGSLTLTAPGGANNGGVLLTANLGSAAGSYCNPGSSVAATNAGRSYLLGRWNDSADPDGIASTRYDDKPTARAAFGLYGGQPNSFIYFRENF